MFASRRQDIRHCFAISAIYQPISRKRHGLKTWDDHAFCWRILILLMLAATAGCIQTGRWAAQRDWRRQQDFSATTADAQPSVAPVELDAAMLMQRSVVDGLSPTFQSHLHSQLQASQPQPQLHVQQPHDAPATHPVGVIPRQLTVDVQQMDRSATFIRDGSKHSQAHAA